MLEPRFSENDTIVRLSTGACGRVIERRSGRVLWGKASSSKHFSQWYYRIDGEGSAKTIFMVNQY